MTLEGMASSAPTGARTFVFVDVTPQRSDKKHNAQVVKSQARAYGHQQRIKREQGGGKTVTPKRQRRLLRPPVPVTERTAAAAATKVTSTQEDNPTRPKFVVEDDKRSATQTTARPKVSLLNILGGGRVDPFVSSPLLSADLSLCGYLDHWITVLAPAVCGLSSGVTSEPSMKSVWMPLAYGDQTLFAATMFSSIAHMHLMRPEPGPEYFFWKGKTLEEVKRNMVDSEKATSDTNIAAVLCLARFGGHDKDGPVQHAPHKDMLKRMIRLRGGLENLGLDGVLAKLITLCDLLSATIEGTPSFFFPDQGPAPTWCSPRVHLRRFSCSSPLLDCRDMVKIRAMPSYGKQICAVVFELQAKTVALHRDTRFVESRGDSSNAEENRYLEITHGISYSALSKSIGASDKYILGACLMASRIYQRAIVHGIPFTDDMNLEPMRYLMVMLERIGIEGSWSLMPGMLTWMLLTGAAVAAGTPEKEYFVGQLVRMGMGIGLQMWDEFRTTILNFVCVQKEMKQRAAGRGSKVMEKDMVPIEARC